MSDILIIDLEGKSDEEMERIIKVLSGNKIRYVRKIHAILEIVSEVR